MLKYYTYIHDNITEGNVYSLWPKHWDALRCYISRFCLVALLCNASLSDVGFFGNAYVLQCRQGMVYLGQLQTWRCIKIFLQIVTFIFIWLRLRESHCGWFSLMEKKPFNNGQPLTLFMAPDIWLLNGKTLLTLRLLVLMYLQEL